MRFDEIWPWLEAFTNLEKNPSSTPRVWRLDRMRALLEVFSHPESGRPTFHLAGSKGKGSTAAFTASILAEAGFQAGLYASPHLVDWRERITQNGNFYPKGVYEGTFELLKSFWQDRLDHEKTQFEKAWGGPPTTFEFLTLGAFLTFRDQKCDVQVLETGLGGRLDATNVCLPDICVLTLIEYEHTEILGSTLELIAAEKAGILKPGVPAVVARQPEAALKVFISKAREQNCPLVMFDEEVADLRSRSGAEGTSLEVSLSDGSFLRGKLPVLGRHQAENAVLAALAVRHWASRNKVSPPNKKSWFEAIAEGWSRVRLDGRMEVIASSPLLVIDGAHTVHSAAAAATTWSEAFGSGGVLVFGAFDGKDIEGMAKVLAAVFDKVLICPPGEERPSSPGRMAQAFLDCGLSSSSVSVFDSPREAWSVVKGLGLPTLVLGSFYLAGKFKTWSQDL